MNAAYAIRVVCCVCKVELGTKPTCCAEQDGQISHSYCPPCSELAMAEARAAATTFAARQLRRQTAA